jgi:hypothetical protein
MHIPGCLNGKRMKWPISSATAKPVVPKDDDEAVKDLKLIDAIYLADRTGKSVEV